MPASYHTTTCNACGVIVTDAIVDPFKIGLASDHENDEIFFALCGACASELNIKDSEELF